jgi:hypothetical protein
MGEPSTSQKSLGPFVMKRMGEALRARFTLHPTLPSGLYNLVMRLEPPGGRSEGPDAEVPVGDDPHEQGRRLPR